ncbi:hypothetical protein SDC9_135434 [bioreactor metagenome]|uniref:Uncharacterized protein n=1 Tax=bioreactor metagenome TaxID=1076179 RepID=A0A645DIB0_9ZZZZ
MRVLGQIHKGPPGPRHIAGQVVGRVAGAGGDPRDIVKEQLLLQQGVDKARRIAGPHAAALKNQRRIKNITLQMHPASLPLRNQRPHRAAGLKAQPVGDLIQRRPIGIKFVMVRLGIRIAQCDSHQGHIRLGQARMPADAVGVKHALRLQTGAQPVLHGRQTDGLGKTAHIHRAPGAEKGLLHGQNDGRWGVKIPKAPQIPSRTGFLVPPLDAHVGKQRPPQGDFALGVCGRIGRVKVEGNPGQRLLHILLGKRGQHLPGDHRDVPGLGVHGGRGAQRGGQERLEDFPLHRPWKKKANALTGLNGMLNVQNPHRFP